MLSYICGCFFLCFLRTASDMSVVTVLLCFVALVATRVTELAAPLISLRVLHEQQGPKQTMLMLMATAITATAKVAGAQPSPQIEIGHAQQQHFHQFLSFHPSYFPTFPGLLDPLRYPTIRHKLQIAQVYFPVWFAVR